MRVRNMGRMGRMGHVGRWAALGLLLGGCANQDVGNTLKTTLGATVAGVASTVPGVTVTPNTPEARSAFASISPLLAKPGTPPLMTRPQASLAALYAKREVNGRELVDELVAMRKAMKEQRTARAVAGFMGAIDGGAASLASGRGSGGVDWVKLAGNAGMKLFESLVQQQVQSIGYQALDEYLGFLIDDPRLLPAERIRLPSPQGLTLQQQQRGATMAALVVATRVTAKVLKKAQEDFASLETEYADLIGRREKAAGVIHSLLAEKRGAGLEKDFNGPDLAYLYDAMQRLPLQQFVNDLGTQNLALQHLRRTDPKAFEGYQTKAEGLTGRTRGLLRTSSGVLAFGALLANFSQSIVAVAKDKSAAEIIGLLPMGLDFVNEAPPIIKHAFDAGTRGVEVLAKSNNRFRVVNDKGEVQELARASDVFALMKKVGEPDQLFNEALFRDGSPGLLYRLYNCDRAEAGRLIDAAVPVAERDRFASTYLQSEDARFSFANAFEQPRAGSTREQELGDELLRRDHRRSTDERTRSFSGVQGTVSKGYAQWGDEQLLRLIFTNREGQAQHATLQLGDLRLRPVPNMQSVYTYESLEACRRALVTPDPASRALPPPKPPAKPAAKPPATAPASTKPKSS